jgi:hypothetical protein
MLTPRQKTTVAVIATLPLLFLCGFVTFFMLCRIGTACTLKRDFNTLDLGLPPELFPESALVQGMSRPSTSDGAFEAGLQSAQWEYDYRYQRFRVANHMILRFRTVRQAQRQFERYSVNLESFEDPPNNHPSQAADRFEVGCKDDYISGGPGCFLAAQYQEYVVFLTAPVDHSFEIADFNEIVAYIDQMMTKRLAP